MKQLFSKIICISALIACSLSAAPQNRSSELHAAIQKGEIEQVDSLLEEGVEVDSHSLSIAFQQKNRPLIEKLIQAGGDVNAYRGYLLRRVIGFCPGQEPDLELVSLLLEYGANPNIRNESGTTAYHHAIFSKMPKCVKLLEEANAEVTAATRILKKVIRDPSCFVAAFNSEKEDLTDEMRTTLLNLACVHDAFEMVEFLHQNDARIKQSTLLAAAMGSFDGTLLEWVLANGPKPASHFPLLGYLLNVAHGNEKLLTSLINPDIPLAFEIKGLSLEEIAKQKGRWDFLVEKHRELGRAQAAPPSN